MIIYFLTNFSVEKVFTGKYNNFTTNIILYIHRFTKSLNFMHSKKFAITKRY